MSALVTEHFVLQSARSTTVSEAVGRALASTAMRAGISEMFFTSASMIAAVTSILAGAAAALLMDVAGLPIPAAIIVGVGVALPTFGLHMVWMYWRGRPAMA
jgi:hypothetical protein